MKAREVNWAEVQKERDAGVRTCELAKKYNVSEGSVYNHTKTPASKARKASKSETHRPAPTLGGHSHDSIIRDLEKRRAEYEEKIMCINKAIDALRGL